MLDVINLPDDTTIECDLQEIPQEFVERVNLHLLENEVPFLCVLTKFFDGVGVFVLSPYRAVRVKAKIHKKKLTFTEYDAGSGSLMFSDFRGLTHKEHGAHPTNYDLHFLGHSGSIEFQFKDKNLFFKFASGIVSCANQKRDKKE
jgi:hypothetical protein